MMLKRTYSTAFLLLLAACQGGVESERAEAEVPPTSGLERAAKQPEARDTGHLCANDDPASRVDRAALDVVVRDARFRVDPADEVALKAPDPDDRLLVIDPGLVPSPAPDLLEAQQVYLDRAAGLRDRLSGEALERERARLKSELLD